MLLVLRVCTISQKQQHIFHTILNAFNKNLETILIQKTWTIWSEKKRVHKSKNQQAFSEHLNQHCSDGRLKCLLWQITCKCVFFCGKVSLDEALSECYLRDKCAEYFATLFIEGGFSCVHTLHEVSLVLISKDPTYQDVIWRIKKINYVTECIKQGLYCPIIG